MLGAHPLCLTAGLNIEEGFALAELHRIVESTAAAARDADVLVVAGDPKVVEKGKGDGVIIATTGVGVVPESRRISGSLARRGNALPPSGTIGDHGIAVLSRRESLEFDTTVESDGVPSTGSFVGCSQPRPKARCTRCAIRREVDSRPRSTKSPGSRLSASISSRARSRSGRGSRRRANCSASTRCTWSTKRRWSRSWRRSLPTRRWRRCAGIRLGRERRGSAPCDARSTPPRPDGRPLRWPAFRRLAGRRAVAEGLLAS